MKLVTTEFKSGGLHEKHVVATWNLGKHLKRSSICTESFVVIRKGTALSVVIYIAIFLNWTFFTVALCFLAHFINREF